MSPLFCGARFTSPRQQRGAIGLMAAITLGLVLIMMLLVIDSGRLYLEQRKLQRVADMAVLEAVSRGGNCISGTALDFARQSATRNAFTPNTAQTIAVSCGTLVTNAKSLRTFSADPSKSDAIRVIATNTLPTSVAGGMWNLYYNGKFGFNSTLTASAVGAVPGATLAQLSIRSTLATVSTAQSPLLNLVFTTFLGGNVNVTAAGWDGLVKADINLLQFLDQLAIELKVAAGDYTNLLSTNATLTQLIKTAATVAKLNGATADIQTALANLQVAALNKTPIKLGDLLKLQTGTTSSGLDANIQLFQLLQAFVQVANKNSAVAATLPINLLGLANVTTQIKIIQPPQFSAIGNPALAKAAPLGANKIYVRTAQIRTLISIDIPVLKLVSGLVSAIQDLLTPLKNLLNSVLCILGICSTLDPQLLPSTIDINLEAGGASSYLTDYTCSNTDANKSLTAHSQSSIAALNLGQIDKTKVFSSSDPVTVTPLPVLDIGTIHCITIICNRTAFGGGGIAISAQTTVAQTTQDLIFTGPIYYPRNLKQLPSPSLKMKPTENIIASLTNTLSGVSIKLYKPSSDGASLLGAVVTVMDSALTTAFNTVLGLLTPVIKNFLSPLLDPIINNLLSMLGINLMETEIGANLSCGQGGRAQLVL